MQKYFFVFVVLLIFSGCVSSSKVNYPPPPSWVTNRPSLPQYYVGIAVVNKQTPDYMQAAKNNALADLAGDISVVISSNSVLRAFEIHQKFSEDFSSTIKAETQKELEGYELVDTYEDQYNYWVYYRLSKQTYRELVERKKTNAVTVSLDFYRRAQAALENRDIKQALLMLVKALEPLKPYFGEAIIANHQGETIQLGNEIIAKITEVLNSIEIDCCKNLSVKVGQPVSYQQLSCKLKDNSGTPLTSIPIRATYSERPSLNNRLVTDRNGDIPFAIDVVKSLKTTETITLTLDWERMLQEATADFAIRRLLIKFSVPSAEIRLSTQKPTIQIVVDQPNKEDYLDVTPIMESLKRKLTDVGFVVNEQSPTSDYRIALSIQRKSSGQSGNYYHAELAIRVVVTDTNGKDVFQWADERVKGTHFNLSGAEINALNEVRKKIDSSVAENIIERIRNGS